MKLGSSAVATSTHMWAMLPVLLYIKVSFRQPLVELIFRILNFGSQLTVSVENPYSVPQDAVWPPYLFMEARVIGLNTFLIPTLHSQLLLCLEAVSLPSACHTFWLKCWLPFILKYHLAVLGSPRTASFLCLLLWLWASCVDQADFQLLIFLCQPPNCWLQAYSTTPGRSNL